MSADDKRYFYDMVVTVGEKLKHCQEGANTGVPGKKIPTDKS